MVNPNAPHFILAAIKRIYPELPALIDGNWEQVGPQVDDDIRQLEEQPNAYMPATQLVQTLSSFGPAIERLNAELKVQVVVYQNIAEPLNEIASTLDVDEGAIDGLYAAMSSRLQWDVDRSTIPEVDDHNQRTITFTQDGFEGAKSVKFRNMRLDMSDFTKLAAGFMTTGADLMDKPHPLLIAAGILLTINVLQDTIKIKLSEQDASVFWGMIQLDDKKTLAEADILESTNVARDQYGLELLTDLNIRNSLRKLANINSIEKVDDGYRVIEKYKITD